MNLIGPDAGPAARASSPARARTEDEIAPLASAFVIPAILSSCSSGEQVKAAEQEVAPFYRMLDSASSGDLQVAPE